MGDRETVEGREGARLTPTPRILVILTVAEADAVAQLEPDSAFATRALAKIRTALGQTIAATLSVPADAVALPPLRAKDYQPRDHRRMAKATIHPPIAPLVEMSAPVPDDYVPWRDEAAGVYS